MGGLESAQCVDSVVIGIPLMTLLEAAQLAALMSFTRWLSERLP